MISFNILILAIWEKCGSNTREILKVTPNTVLEHSILPMEIASSGNLILMMLMEKGFTKFYKRIRK
jgi:hypothetical protein